METTDIIVNFHDYLLSVKAMNTFEILDKFEMDQVSGQED